MTANLLRFPGLFSVFWPILTSLLSDGLDSSDFQSLQVFFPSLWRPFQVFQLLLVSPSPSCSTIVFFFISLTKSKYISIFSLSFIFTLRSAGTTKYSKWQVLFFLIILLMVFHWSLNDSKSPQISRTLLSILTNLNNAVVWMVFTCPLISKFSSLFTIL